jgi:hypothetical protein
MLPTCHVRTIFAISEIFHCLYASVYAVRLASMVLQDSPHWAPSSTMYSINRSSDTHGTPHSSSWYLIYSASLAPE